MSFILPGMVGSIAKPLRNFYSLDFDGVNDYVSVPDSDDLSFGNGTTDSPFSVTAWVKADSWTKFRIISKFQDNSNREWVFTGDGAGNLALSLFDLTGSNSLNRWRLTPLSTGVWYHVGATYSGGGSYTNINLYVDGALVSMSGSTQGTYVAMHNTSGAVQLGKLNITTPDYANGLIAEAQIWDKELSADEMSNLYNTGALAPNTANTVMNLPLEEGSGTSVADASGNGHSGTISGATWSTSVP